MEETEQNTEAPTTPTHPFAALTVREAAVAILLARGWRNAEIAVHLEISVKTVDTHRAHALKKLGLRGNVELAHLAIKCSVIEARDLRGVDAMTGLPK